ncbi:efflux RND transporter permease subunit [Natrialbaceae archaeon A-gly3]
MTQLGERIEEATARLNHLIVDRPRTVVAVFLLLTVVFAGGMTAITTEADATDSFTEDIPEQEAFDAVNEEFEDPFTADSESTPLVHTGGNVLSQEELVYSLRVLERVEERPELRMESGSGPATIVAQALDPTTQSATEQRRVVEQASEREIRQAVREASEQPGFTMLVSDDFNENSLEASASMMTISHDVPPEFDSDEDLQGIQTTIDDIASDEPTDIRAFGGGIINEEFENIIGDSMAIVLPVVLVLLLGFLAVAYRDPIDLALGLLALLMTIIWTFGFLGFSGIPFDQQLISVPVLLLAVGVDFGIHIINRYREETVQGFAPVQAMRTATNQLSIAFIIVTATAAFGFGANIISDLEPIRNLGIVSSVGIVFTFVIFGFFLPAAKLEVDRFRDRVGVPEFNSTPIASEDSALGRVLAMPANLSKRAPLAVVVVLLLLGGAMAGYGAGVDTTFDEEDFLPPEEEAAYVQYIPEPFAPGEYTVTETLNILEDRFEANQDETVTIYIEGPLEDDFALTELTAPDENPTESLAVGPDGNADGQSLVTVINAYADQDEEFAQLVDRNDRTGNGVPDRNLDRIYAELEQSPQVAVDQYLTEDRRSTQIQYSIDAEASQEEVTEDASEFADQFRYSATATGMIVIFDAISTMIFESAIQGLIVAIALTAVFLVIAYGILEGKPLLGVVNVIPIMIAVAALIATMRYLGMPLNALTATILSISIGIGIAYSVHTTARFIDEFDDSTDVSQALNTTLIGTGGALAGSMLTTSTGTGALALAITPVLGDFGFLMGLSVFYSFVASIIALPPAMFVWAKFDPKAYAWVPNWVR